MNRREFIRSGLQATSLLAATSIGCATTPFRARDESAIVIGAGIAGIMAARELEAAGFRVTVLEASRRIGGRIYTSRELGTPIELGASRLHGTRNNPLVPLIQQAGCDYTPVDWDVLSGFETDGTPLSEEALSKVRDRLLNVFRRAFIRNLAASEDFPIERIIQRELTRRKLTRAERRIFFFAVSSAEMTNASPFTEASWKNALEYQAFSGGDQFITNGYDAVTDMLATNLDIKTEQRVQAIDYSRSVVRVTTDTGTLEAHRVLVTVPLGVLKAGNITFDPPLPEAKQETFHRIGMGTVNKVALRFPKAFWPTHVHALVHGTDIRGEYSAFVNVARYTGDPVLVAFVPGSFKNGLEDLSDADAIGGAVEVLRRMYGSSVPDPVSAVRTRWGAHPFTRGSFSFNKIGGSRDDRDILARPVDDRVFFAGEATSRTKFGSVSGAYLSGIRAAREISETPSVIVA